jgi:RNA polymerase sigma-70 factor (ECF subfamily)
MTVDPEGLCVANQPRLFKYFLRAVGQIETARDLTQDVFLRVSRAAVPQVPDGELRAWLFRIARNLALDHHRRHRHEPLAIRPALDPARASSQEVDAAVHEALASLPDLDRDVFLMREMAGLGYDEIAKACELTPDAVRSRIHRTRLQLRSRLATPIATRRTMPMCHSGREV